MENEEHEKEEHSEMIEHKEMRRSKSDFTDKLRKNPWIASTIVLGVVLLIVVFTGFGSGTGKVVGVDKAGDNWVGYLEGMGYDVDLKDVSSESGMYKVTFDYDGQESSVFLTPDAEFYSYGGLVPISTEETSSPTETSTEITQTDKPSVGLYIWSYCPYGVTAQAPFAQVASLLGNYADFKIYMYYAGHGPHEVQQNKIQACIQDLGSDKYWDYAEKFVSDIYPKCSGDVDCDKTESVKLMKSLGIDSDAVMNCVDAKGEELTAADSGAASSAGVSGSPTLIINGVKSNSARTAEAYKTAVCSAFTNPPEACGEVLDSTAAAASGNCG